MGRELERIGAPFRQPEWSALTLMEDPDKVCEAHCNFINVGCNIITTNVYALVPFHVGDSDTKSLASIAVQQAIEAKKQSRADVQIAGCIPPAFGSYRPDLFNLDEYDHIISPLVQAQQNYVDLWIVETVTSIEEAKSALTLLKKTPHPIIVSFNLKEDNDDEPRLRSDELLSDALGAIQDRNVKAILFNCNEPESMNNAIILCHSLCPDIATGAYANSFSKPKRALAANKKLNTIRDEMTPESYLEFAKTWVQSGASIIGGCCGIEPRHIKAISQHFKGN